MTHQECVVKLSSGLTQDFKKSWQWTEYILHCFLQERKEKRYDRGVW